MDWTVRTFAVWTGRNEHAAVVLQNGVEIHRVTPRTHEIDARRAAIKWLDDFTWGRRVS